MRRGIRIGQLLMVVGSALVAALIGVSAHSLQEGNCEPEWVPTFGDPLTALDGTVTSIVHFDDGSGPALYVAGAFSHAGGIDARRIARWDGTTWSQVGGEVGVGVIYALAVFDDGSGPALYAGGTFSSIGGVAANRIARWDGEKWSLLGEGVDNRIDCMTVFDDGSGPALYVGGWLMHAGGTAAKSIARWDGTEWSAVGEGLNNDVLTLAVFDDGTGPALYAGGRFGASGSVSMPGLARWDGQTWSAVGGSMNQYVNSLTAADLGDGPRLFAAGTFTRAGDVDARYIASWDGESWSALGDGLSSYATAIAAFDDGRGEALYVAGPFLSAGNVATRLLARWNGAEWSSPRQGVNHFVYTIVPVNDGDQRSLYLGGSFTTSPSGDPYLAVYRACEPSTLPAPLVDFTIAFGSLLDGGLDELIESDDERLRARSGIGFSALEPTVLDLRIGAISPNVNAASINSTIEARINNPNGAAAVRLRNWSTNQFETVHTYTIGTTETAEEIEAIDATNHIRATDGRIELSHKTVVAATFSALGFDGAFDQIALEVVD